MRRPDMYRLLLQYGVKPDHGQYGGVWDSISGFEEVSDMSKLYESLTIDTYRLLWAEYEGDFRLLENIRQGGPFLTRQLRWSSVGVWLFQESRNNLLGSELTDFRHAVLRGMFINFIRDANIEGLQWFRGVLHTSAAVRLVEDICHGDFGLIDTFFGDEDLVQPQSIGATIISALSILDIDIEACIVQELIQFPLSVIKCPGWRLDKKITYSRQNTGGHTLDWDWIFDESAPGYLLLTALPSLTVDSTTHMPCHGDFLPHKRYGPLFANRHDHAKIHRNTGEEKWPPRFDRRQAKKELRRCKGLGQKLIRTKMPGSWVS